MYKAVMTSIQRFFWFFFEEKRNLGYTPQYSYSHWCILFIFFIFYFYDTKDGWLFFERAYFLSKSGLCWFIVFFEFIMDSQWEICIWGNHREWWPRDFVVFIWPNFFFLEKIGSVDTALSNTLTYFVYNILAAFYYHPFVFEFLFFAPSPPTPTYTLYPIPHSPIS